LSTVATDSILGDEFDATLAVGDVKGVLRRVLVAVILGKVKVVVFLPWFMALGTTERQL
jgi:hypothetical protein